MDVAKEICENLSKLYPSDLYLAMSSNISGHGNLNRICNKNDIQVFRLPISNGEVDDDSLKSLLHRTVFECRGTKPNADRAGHIFKQVIKMLPGRNNMVSVSDDDFSYKLYGSHKGTTDFIDPEFGANVAVILF